MDKDGDPMRRRTREEAARCYDGFMRARQARMKSVTVEAGNETAAKAKAKAKARSLSGGKLECESSEDSCSVNVVKEELVSGFKEVGTSNNPGEPECTEFVLVDCEGDDAAGVNLGKSSSESACDCSGSSKGLAGNGEKPESDPLECDVRENVSTKCGVSTFRSPVLIYNISSDSGSEDEELSRDDISESESSSTKDSDSDSKNEESSRDDSESSSLKDSENSESSNEEDDDNTSDEDFCPIRSSKSFPSNKSRGNKVSTSIDRKKETVKAEEDEDEREHSESEDDEEEEEEEEDDDNSSDEDLLPNKSSKSSPSNKSHVKKKIQKVEKNEDLGKHLQSSSVKEEEEDDSSSHTPNLGTQSIAKRKEKEHKKRSMPIKVDPIPSRKFGLNNRVPQQTTRMADRLRSSNSLKKRKNNESEICITPKEDDGQENDASMRQDSENGIEKKEKANESIDNEQNESSSDDNKEDIVKPMHPMPLKKRHKVLDKTSVNKILVDSLWDHIDLTSSPCHEQEHFEIPKNFGLEDYDAKPPEEKSYWEIEGEKLFEEMDFTMATERIGATHSNIVGNDQTPVNNMDVDDNTLQNCGHNSHFLVLDEEIGLKCTRCSYVVVEIRYVSPTFAANPWKKTKTKEFREKRNDIDDIDRLNQMHFENGRTNLNEDIVDTAGSVWGLIPGMRGTMYSHQRDGFEFIWKNLEGSILLEELKEETSNGGNGCIISHAPGTGKTRLTIMFIKSYLELYPTRKVVIIAPCNMLLTWEEEFKKWKVNIPFHNLNKTEFSGQEDTTVVNLVRQLRHQQKVNYSNRLIKLLSWKKDKSVLGMSYALFVKSAGDGGNMIKSGKNQIDCFQVMEMLRELPDLLVLDEGHTPRNENTQIWKALSRIKTQKRIILSGTPFQNNFRELYTTLCLIRPMFADKFIAENGHGTSTKRKRDGKEDIALNKWVSLTKGVCENDDDRLEEVRDIIYRMAHVYKGDILKESLPGLRDSLVVLKPTEFQNTILNVILKMKNGLEREHCITLVSVHPSLLIHSQLSGKEELSVYMPQLDARKQNPEVGVKTKFIVELIRLSESLNEKVLIFSQYIDPLNLIKDQLKFLFDWSEGKEMLYMDGTKDTKLRQLSITSFNNSDSTVKVMLASTKACNEGISLVGASRVVLLDVVWNPSVERQAISRAYRIGQKKLVHIYHLVAGEAESAKYSRQTQKDRLSKLVFSSTNDNHDGINKKLLMGSVGEDKILQEMVQHEKTCHMFEKIINQEKECSLFDAHEVLSRATSD